jgi:3-deoxy-D-manno-octulosonic-acid transferase
LILYNLLALALALICLPFLLAVLLLGGHMWRHRLGFLPRTSPNKNLLWLHGASVGEVGVIAPLISQLRALVPGAEAAVSTMTATGQKRAAELLGGDLALFFIPLDFMAGQLLALARIRPRAVILTETELWPNLIGLCHLKGIPVFLVNARLSLRSLPFYRALAFLFGPLLNAMGFIACQTEEDAGRYSMLGVSREKLIVTGNLKYDGIKGQVTAPEREALRTGLGLDAADIVLAAGSTREGEEEIIFAAWQEVQNQKSKIKNQNIKLIIAPRHPDRFSEVEELIKSRNFKYAKRSLQKEVGVSADYEVLLLDTIGELVNVYAASDLAFVGGSLVPVGGHNPLEPAALGLPVMFGPHMFNARESAEGLLKCGGAVQVADAVEMGKVIAAWANDPDIRKKAGDKGRAFVDSQRGSTLKTARMVAEHLN